ncbi:MAG: hypothetical protein HKO57_02630 [Akkermansiaceae bacterium]|nr:hypothetical protein [Akkermansiaceae bacterium]
MVFLSFALEGLGGTSGGKVKFPVEGERVTLAAAETYWRKPDREKDTGVVFSARIIPVSSIELGGGQGSGALRFFFENDRGVTIGDPLTFAVADGTFVPGGERRLEVHATNGFDDIGDHAAYVTDQIGTWHLVVKEGPGPRAVGSEFKELARIPISKQLR